MKTMQVIKNGEKSQIFVDAGVPCVEYLVMTASGEATKTKVCQTMAEAEAFFSEREANTMPTNGFELHTAPNL